MLLLLISSLAVLVSLLLAGLYWRWRLPGLLLGGVFVVGVMLAYSAGLALVYTDSDTLPKAISRPDFFVGTLIGVVLFLAGALMSVLAFETRRGSSRTLREILDRAFGSKRGRGAEWQVVNGTLQQTRFADLGVTEPGRIIIPKNQAVIFEDSSGRFSRVEFGPIVVPECPDAQPKIVIATRPRFKRFSISDVSTADGVLIDRVDFCLLYELENGPTLNTTESIHDPILEASLLKAVYKVAQWEDGNPSEADSWQTAVEDTAKNIVRAQLGQTSLVQLYEQGQPAVMQTLENDIRRAVNTIIGQWGAIATILQINHITLPSHIQKRLEELWMSERMRAIQVAEGAAEGEKMKQIEAAKGEAWTKLIRRMSSSLGRDQSLALKYIAIFEYLDSLARSPQSSSSTTAGPVADLLSLILGLEQEPRHFVVDSKEKGEANIIGKVPEEKMPPEGKGNSEEAAI